MRRLMGFVAYNEQGAPCGMGPTQAAAVFDARQRGCQSGRLRRATAKRVREASEAISPPVPSPAVEAGPASPPDADTPSQAYFEMAKRGDFAAARRLLSAEEG